MKNSDREKDRATGGLGSVSETPQDWLECGLAYAGIVPPGDREHCQKAFDLLTRYVNSGQVVTKGDFLIPYERLISLCRLLEKSKETALEIAELGVANFPQHPDAYLLRANSHRMLGHVRLAVDDFILALKLKENYYNQSDVFSEPLTPYILVMHRYCAVNFSKMGKNLAACGYLLRGLRLIKNRMKYAAEFDSLFTQFISNSFALSEREVATVVDELSNGVFDEEIVNILRVWRPDIVFVDYFEKWFVKTGKIDVNYYAAQVAAGDYQVAGQTAIADFLKSLNPMLLCIAIAALLLHGDTSLIEMLGNPVANTLLEAYGGADVKTDQQDIFLHVASTLIGMRSDSEVTARWCGMKCCGTEATLRVADMLKTQRLFEMAAALYERELPNIERGVYVLYSLAFCCYHLGRYEKMTEFIKMTGSPPHPEALLLAEWTLENLPEDHPSRPGLEVIACYETH